MKQTRTVEKSWQDRAEQLEAENKKPSTEVRLRTEDAHDAEKREAIARKELRDLTHEYAEDCACLPEDRSVTEVVAYLRKENEKLKKFALKIKPFVDEHCDNCRHCGLCDFSYPNTKGVNLFCTVCDVYSELESE